MKKRIMAMLLTVVLALSLLVVGCDNNGGGASGATDLASVDFSGEDPQLETHLHILTVWGEDEDNGWLINKIAEMYRDQVNPNFSWDYEMVSYADVNQRIAILAASNDLPDIFAYDAGALLQELIEEDVVLNISEALATIGASAYVEDGAASILKTLSNTDDLYALPMGLNIEGFWYNKELFAQAGVEAPETWDEFEAVLSALYAAGIQPITTGGGDRWPATRLLNAYAVRTMGNDVMARVADGEIDFTDPGFVAVADKLVEWVDKGYFGRGITTVDHNTAGSMVMTGQAAIFYTGSWFTGDLNDPDQNPAGPDGIGFFNIPVVDPAISSPTSFSMNCGNILALDREKFDEGTAWFLKFFVQQIGDLAMDEFGVVRGFTYDESALADLPSYTQLFFRELGRSTEGFPWWEARMDAETSNEAQANVQSLLNGDMTGLEYMQALQDVMERNR